MFDTSHDRIVILRPATPAESRLPDTDKLPDRLPDTLPDTLPDSLKECCLDSASLWVLKRRANLPYRPPQRLPMVARVG